MFNFIKAAKKLGKHRTLPVLNHVRILPDKLQFTNIDILIEYPLETGVTSEKFIDLITLQGLVKKKSIVSFTDTHITIDGLELPFVTGLEDKFPICPFITNDVTEATSQTVTSAQLKQVAFAMSKEETRYYLCGIYFDDNQIVGLDGHRMAVLEGNFSGKFILSSKAVNLMLALDSEFTIAKHGESRVKITGNGLTIYSKLIDGIFPDYKRVIPADFAQYGKFDAAATKTACEKAIKLSREKVAAVHLNGNEVYYMSELTDKITLAPGCGNPEFKFKVNAQYLFDCLSQYAGEIQIASNCGNTPMMIKTEGYTQIIMGMR